MATGFVGLAGAVLEPLVRAKRSWVVPSTMRSQTSARNSGTRLALPGTIAISQENQRSTFSSNEAMNQTPALKMMTHCQGGNTGVLVYGVWFLLSSALAFLICMNWMEPMSYRVGRLWERCPLVEMRSRAKWDMALWFLYKSIYGWKLLSRSNARWTVM